ncbi:hypothetical protein E4G67_04575 [Candidatus Bathyarchaeota archaeon]|nr:MAG: hypothetical protein E4G67_04575 [Candidatus Bathyarchaeota archaeon]
MKSKTDPPDFHHKNYPYTFTPLITTVAFPLLIVRQKNAESTQEKSPENKKPKSKSFAIIKYEVSDNKIKFFDAKGFPKKRWVLIKEMPIQEISSIESFGNELRITWNEEVYTFVSKKNSESVISLCDQIQSLLKDRQKTIENNEKSYLRKNDLRKVMDVIDLSFDILMELNEKMINWIHLEGNAEGLMDSWKLNEGAPLNLDFANVSAAIKRRIAEEISKEAFGILKSVYEYFDGLKPEDDQKDNSVNAPNAKNLILAYYMLNDVLFGNVVGEVDNEKENQALESALLNLANGSNVKANIEELKNGLYRLGVEGDRYRIFNDIRASFKEKLSLL